METKNGDPADSNIVGVTMMIELNEIMVPVGDDNPLPVSGSFSITGGATAANQVLEISALDAINAKTPASPATSGKQDTGNTSVASIDTKMSTLLTQTD